MNLEDLDGEKLCTELVRVINRLGGETGPGFKRLRIAVTGEEMEAIKAYIFKSDPGGVFYMRLRNVPLVVDDDPYAEVLRGEMESVA